MQGNAELILRHREVFEDDSQIEMVISRVPRPVPPATHAFKYRLVYAVEGARVVGYDNERGKGDHCHLDGRQYPYAFVGIDQLSADFLNEVGRRRP